MEVKGSKIRASAYYEDKKYTRTFDLEEYRKEEYRKRDFTSWTLAQQIMGDLGPELIGTTLTFDAGGSGLWDLLNAFLANALIRGYFKPMGGKVELQTDVKANMYFEPIVESHIEEHIT